MRDRVKGGSAEVSQTSSCASSRGVCGAACEATPTRDSAINMQWQAQQGERACSTFWSRCGCIRWVADAEEHGLGELADEHGAGDGHQNGGRRSPMALLSATLWEKLFPLRLRVIQLSAVACTQIATLPLP